MSSNDSSSDLDSRISQAVENSVGRMRDELLQRLQDNENRLRAISRHLRGESEPEPAAEPAGVDAGAELLETVATMDRGATQREVLAALLEGVGRFASRSALFLTRGDSAQGWGSYGFDELEGEIQQVSLSYAEGPLATLTAGRGCVALGAEQCAALCREMGAAAGAEGLLLPFVLRDQLAATLYVDRFAHDPPLRREAVQLLTYVGAQVVEGLALRKRADTSTLKVDSEAAAAAPAPPAAITSPPPAPEPETRPGPELSQPSLSEPQITAPEITAPEITEPQITAPEITEPEITEPEIAEPEIAEPEIAEPEITEPEIDAPAVAEPTPPREPVEEVAEEPTVAEPPVEPAPPAEEEWEIPPSLDEQPAIELPAAEEPTRPLESLSEEPAEAAAAEPQPWAATAGSDLSGVESAPAPEPVAPPPGDDAAGEGGQTTEVRPPTDVTGPGWAFTASRAAAEGGDDAQHEEARRLARLLVTEIKLYNEEQVEEGRRSNDIYPRLREDIDRSRQIFNERVDEAVRQDTDYFHEEMVRILGGGNAEALGV